MSSAGCIILKPTAFSVTLLHSKNLSSVKEVFRCNTVNGFSGAYTLIIVSVANSIIDDRNYEMLIKDIQAEQEALEQKLSALQSKISQQHNTELSVEQFRETVKECLNATELTPFILNKLINGIEIGCLEIVDGQKQQVVSVEWKCLL